MRLKVVYILGAGFSAPLGLPVVANFLSRSKDLYSDNPGRYGHFTAVFQEIGRMAQAKNYLNVDLFNIEQILSILDMEDYAVGTNHREQFTKYLADTIDALTPDLKPKLPTHLGNWEDYLFIAEDKGRAYCQWLAGLLGLTIRTTSQTDAFDTAEPADAGTDFGVISLNYDMVLEKCLDAINRSYEPVKTFAFRTKLEGEGLPLAKLHGSVEGLTIVPPTWQKNASAAVRDAWKLAVHLLTEANEVRILGFSFPETDGYVKYLLSLGAMRAPHLKRIDVLCLDPDGSVRRRYSEFVNYCNGYVFRSADILGYLSSYGQRNDERVVGDYHGHRRVQFQGINEHHWREMSSSK